MADKRLKQNGVTDVLDGPVAQHGWSTRLIDISEIVGSPVQIRPGPPIVLGESLL